MNDFLKDEEVKNNNQSEATNKLLMEMVINQRNNMRNLVKVFISTMVCYTILLIAMVVGYFIYESQFEVVETETVRYEQETTSDDGGNAIGIINNNGDWSYGEGESSSNNNKGKNEIKGE